MRGTAFEEGDDMQCHDCGKLKSGVLVRTWKDKKFVWLCPACWEAWKPRRDRGRAYG